VNAVPDLTDVRPYHSYVQPAARMWPSQSFVRPSLGFRCSKSILRLTTCPYFDNLEFDFVIQVALNATLSRLLPFQLGFQRFQYINLR